MGLFSFPSHQSTTTDVALQERTNLDQLAQSPTIAEKCQQPQFGTAIDYTPVKNSRVAFGLADNLSGSAGWEIASVNDLQLGDQGAGVYRLQHRLRELGYEPGPLDSVFGDGTLSALQEFQQDKKSRIESMIGGVLNQRGTHEYLALTSLGGGMAIDLLEGKTSERTAGLLFNPIIDGALNSELLNEFGQPSGQELVDFIHQAIHSGSPTGFIKVGGTELNSKLFGRFR